MIQGVREVFEIVDLDGGGREGEGKGEGTGGGVQRQAGEEGKLVLIGRGLDEGAFGRSLRGCLEVA